MFCLIEELIGTVEEVLRILVLLQCCDSERAGDVPHPFEIFFPNNGAEHLIESTHIEFHHEILVVTISVGVHTGNKTSLSEFYQIAKRNLEISQQTGHNKMSSTHVNLDDILNDSDSIFALIGESKADDSYDLLEELNQD